MVSYEYYWQYFSRQIWYKKVINEVAYNCPILLTCMNAIYLPSTLQPLPAIQVYLKLLSCPSLWALLNRSEEITCRRKKLSSQSDPTDIAAESECTASVLHILGIIVHIHPLSVRKLKFLYSQFIFKDFSPTIQRYQITQHFN